MNLKIKKIIIGTVILTISTSFVGCKIKTKEQTTNIEQRNEEQLTIETITLKDLLNQSDIDIDLVDEKTKYKYQITQEIIDFIFNNKPIIINSKDCFYNESEYLVVFELTLLYLKIKKDLTIDKKEAFYSYDNQDKIILLEKQEKALVELINNIKKGDLLKKPYDDDQYRKYIEALIESNYDNTDHFVIEARKALDKIGDPNRITTYFLTKYELCNKLNNKEEKVL